MADVSPLYITLRIADENGIITPEFLRWLEQARYEQNITVTTSAPATASPYPKVGGGKAARIGVMYSKGGSSGRAATSYPKTASQRASTSYP